MDTNFHSYFADFLRGVEQTEYKTNPTARGTLTIQQGIRNDLHAKGVVALREDLQNLFGSEFDVVETADGIVVVAENVPGDFTFSWEIKSTIKSLDYDPFIDASNYEAAKEQKEAKRREKENKRAMTEQNLKEKREQKLAEIAAKKVANN